MSDIFEICQPTQDGDEELEYLPVGRMIDGLLMQDDGFHLSNQVDALGKLSPGHQHGMMR